MSLVRTTRNAVPLEEMTQMGNRLRRIFETPFDFDLFPQPVGWVPAVEVTETNDELRVTAELPGMTKENVEISLEGSLLMLRGEKKEERTEDDKDRKVHVYERSYGSFVRSFMLPREIDAEKIRADFADGVLTLHLPKTEKAKGRKIEINSI